ncbi:hypothetical protein MG293_003383 [Ovis ammon polii]|uniref:Uncharacterized protein n=1 Tax=Ovis ammon polii TaxID=230172 RepID=A0AAD4UGM3_OVIAM|nr:hypothetical protein MG293_003383 [Ovis ammon polii]
MELWADICPWFSFTGFTFFFGSSSLLPMISGVTNPGEDRQTNESTFLPPGTSRDLLGLRSLELTVCSEGSHCNKKPPQYLEEQPRSLQLEKPCVQQPRPSTAKNHFLIVWMAQGHMGSVWEDRITHGSGQATLEHDKDR